MAHWLTKFALGCIIGFTIAGFVTACVRNDQKDSVLGEVGERTLTPLTVLKTSENGVSVKNIMEYRGPVYKAIETGWRFNTDSPAQIKIEMEEDVVLGACRLSRQANELEFALRVHKQSPGQVMELGKTYEVPAGQHLVVLTIENHRLCPSIKLIFTAGVVRHLGVTDVPLQKIICGGTVDGRDKKFIFSTRPFEFAELDPSDRTQNSYVVDQSLPGREPSKVFCGERLTQVTCHTKTFTPRQGINLRTGVHSQCLGIDSNGKQVTTALAELAMADVVSGGRPRLQGSFSCINPRTQATYERQLRACHIEYDHGLPLVDDVNASNNFSVNYSCDELRVAFDLTLTQMAQLPVVVYWNIFDERSELYILRQWVRSDRKAVSSRIDELELVLRKAVGDRSGYRSNILKSYMQRDLGEVLPDMRLVLRDRDTNVDSVGVIGHIALGELLGQHPEAFTEISRGFAQHCR